MSVFSIPKSSHLQYDCFLTENLAVILTLVFGIQNKTTFLNTKSKSFLIWRVLREGLGFRLRLTEFALTALALLTGLALPLMIVRTEFVSYCNFISYWTRSNCNDISYCIPSYGTDIFDWTHSPPGLTLPLMIMIIGSYCNLISYWIRSYCTDVFDWTRSPPYDNDNSFLLQSHFILNSLLRYWCFWLDSLSSLW